VALDVLNNNLQEYVLIGGYKLLYQRWDDPYSGLL